MKVKSYQISAFILILTMHSVVRSGEPLGKGPVELPGAKQYVEFTEEAKKKFNERLKEKAQKIKEQSEQATDLKEKLKGQEMLEEYHDKLDKMPETHVEGSTLSTIQSFINEIQMDFLQKMRKTGQAFTRSEASAITQEAKKEIAPVIENIENEIVLAYEPAPEITQPEGAPTPEPKPKGFLGNLGNQLKRVWLETKLAWHETFGKGEKAAEVADNLAKVYRDIDLHTQALLADIKAIKLAREFQLKELNVAQSLKEVIKQYKDATTPEQREGARRNIAREVVATYQIGADALEPKPADVEEYTEDVTPSSELVTNLMRELRPLIDTLINLDVKPADIQDRIDGLKFYDFLNDVKIPENERASFGGKEKVHIGDYIKFKLKEEAAAKA